MRSEKLNLVETKAMAYFAVLVGSASAMVLIASYAYTRTPRDSTWPVLLLIAVMWFAVSGLPAYLLVSGKAKPCPMTSVRRRFLSILRVVGFTAPIFVFSILRLAYEGVSWASALMAVAAGGLAVSLFLRETE